MGARPGEPDSRRAPPRTLPAGSRGVLQLRTARRGPPGRLAVRDPLARRHGESLLRRLQERRDARPLGPARTAPPSPAQAARYRPQPHAPTPRASASAQPGAPGGQFDTRARRPRLRAGPRRAGSPRAACSRACRRWRCSLGFRDREPARHRRSPSRDHGRRPDPRADRRGGGGGRAADALGFGHANVVVAVPQAWIDVRTMADLDEVAADLRARHGRRCGSRRNT